MEIKLSFLIIGGYGRYFVSDVELIEKNNIRCNPLYLDYKFIVSPWFYRYHTRP